MADAIAHELLALPREPPNDPRWSDIEKRMGLSFPAPFKHIAERYGDRPWNDFACILNPLSSGYEDRVERILAADRASRDEFPEHYLFPLYPESHGLFPWATTDNGDTLFWVRLHPRWPTLIRGPRAPEFEVNFSSCELVLYQIAAGTIRSRVLPDLRDP